jgi:hypothetical protein
MGWRLLWKLELGLFRGQCTTLSQDKETKECRSERHSDDRGIEIWRPKGQIYRNISLIRVCQGAMVDRGQGQVTNEHCRVLVAQTGVGVREGPFEAIPRKGAR